MWLEVGKKSKNAYIFRKFVDFFFPFYFTENTAEKQVTVKFVQDTSKFWYKPDISREQGISAEVYSGKYVY